MLKPALYLFDPDQTHDLLWAEQINGNIANLLSNAFQNHGLFDSGLPVVLIDRHIPGGDHLPWASEWSTTYFEFLKELSRTHLLTNGEINGSDYGFTPEYQADLPEELDLGAVFPDTVKVKFAKGTTGSVTWLERSHSETKSGQYCPQVSNKIQVWSRRGRVVTAPKDKDVVIELDSRLWLHNSVVFQSASFEGLPDAQKQLLDYAELDDRLENIYGQFNISACKVLTRCDAVVDTTANHSTPYNSYNYIAITSQSVNYGNPLFQAITAQYYFAALLYAVPPKRDNKSLFTTETQRTDLGKSIILIAVINGVGGLTFSISLLYRRNAFNAWKESIKESNPYGYEVNTTNFVDRVNTWYAPLPIESPFTIRLGGFCNNHNLESPWYSGGLFANNSSNTAANRTATNAIVPSGQLWGESDTGKFKRGDGFTRWNNLSYVGQTGPNGLQRRQCSYPPLSATQVRTFSGEVVTKPIGISKTATHFYVNHYFEAGSLKTVSMQINSVDREPFRSVYTKNGTTGFMYEDHGDFYGYLPPQSAMFVYSLGENAMVAVATLERAISIVFSGEGNDGQNDIFDEWDSVLILSDLIGTWYEENRPRATGLGIALDSQITNTVSIKRFAQKFTVGGAFDDDLSIISTNIQNEATQYFSETGTWEDEFSGNPPMFDNNKNGTSLGAIPIVQSVTLSRSLRIQPLDYPAYLISQWDTAQARHITLFPTEAQMLQLIEPLEGVFTCDPNPDPLQNRNTDPAPNDPNNTEWIGDIMPDSLRVKEIHQALQADKYANDDKDATKARVVNLGWLIDKMSNILGLHFASDGKMLKVRNTEHKKDGDTIPEQWQVGQWGKNNWIAEDGTVVNGVGYAYEVRSNGFATNKFTGEATAIEEGGWVLCNSLIQLLEVKYDDDDRAFGLQDMGANVIPKSDRLGYIKYEGMHGLLVEIAYMLSSMSGNITRSEVLDMKSVAILQELMYAQGLPVTLKTMPAKVAGIDVNIPYPGFEESSPSLVDFLFWILTNLSPLVAGNLAIKSATEEETE